MTMDDIEQSIIEEPVAGMPQDKTTPEIPLEEVEYRVSSAYVRTADAHAVYPVDPEDIHDEWSKKIVAAVLRVVEAKQSVNPANIQEFGHIPEEQITRRINGWRPTWLLSMATYTERCQAEGLRTRSMRAMRDGYNLMAGTPWRDVEATQAQNTQKISQVRIGGVGGFEDDAGYIFEHLTDKRREEYAPLPFPWAWVNKSCKGGMYTGKKYCFAGPPGNRKTSALFVTMHHAVMTLGKRWVHFPFDGGAINEQILKFFVVHWVHLIMKYNATQHERNQILLTCKCRVEGGVIDNYVYVNTVDALKLLYNEDTGCEFPRGALDFFSQARKDMAALQDGKGPGLLVMVSPKSVNQDVYRIAQRLRNEMYGRNGLDAWSLDHMGKPNNKFSEDVQRIPENTRVLTSFTDMEGPPCILISQLSSEGIKNVGKGQDVDPHLRYNQELFQDSDGIWMFQYLGELPTQMNMIAQKNREGRGGPTINYPLRVQPDTGYIWDDPEWATGASRRMRAQQQAAQGRKRKEVGDEIDD